MGISLGNMNVGRFSNGEIRVDINESVRGTDCFVIQSGVHPVNENVMELLVIGDALRRASARRITAVVPHFPYARQDRKARGREPITAKLMANLITTAGFRRLLTIDLHAAQIQGFFDTPVDHLHAGPLIANYFRNKGLKNAVVVSPDTGGVPRARDLAERLGVGLAIIDKRRPEPNVSEVMNIIGNVEGKAAIMVDDLIDTAGTIVSGAQALLERGATEVYAACTHPVFSGPAYDGWRPAPSRRSWSPTRSRWTLKSLGTRFGWSPWRRSWGRPSSAFTKTSPYPRSSKKSPGCSDWPTASRFTPGCRSLMVRGFPRTGTVGK